MEQWKKATELLKSPAELQAMGKTERLEAVKKMEAMEKLYIGYVPDIGTMSFPSEKTGIEENDKKLYQLKEDGAQDAETEVNLGWHLSITNRGQLIAVAHDTTKFELTLRGKIGWENGVELMQEYGDRCYSSAVLQAKGICLTKERYEGLSDWLKATTKFYHWLAERVRTESYSLKYFYLFGAYGSRVDTNWMFISDNDSEYHSFPVRPAAYLSLDTLLDMGDKYYDGSSPERAIKMRVGDLGEELMWSRLRDYEMVIPKRTII